MAKWISASTTTEIEFTYAQCAVAAGVPGAAAEPDPTTKAQLLLSWLKTTERPWIVVLDNVDDPADLQGFLPHGDAGRVIVTTRSRDNAFARYEPIDVGVFTETEAFDYIKERLSGIDAAADALDEAAELAGDRSASIDVIASACLAASTSGKNSCKRGPHS